MKQSLWNSPSLRLVQKKNRPERFSYIAKNMTELYQLSNGLYISFCSKYSDIPERYGVSLRIQSESGKIWTRETPNTDTVYAVTIYN